MSKPKTHQSRAASGFLGTHARVCRAALVSTPASALLRSVFLGVLITTLSLEGIRFGIIERPAEPGELSLPGDPIVASVGSQVLRVSDAFAHAAFVGDDEAEDLVELVQAGTLDDAVDHMALAEAARDEGLDDALEVRAAVALAERQILAEAYLERIVTRAVSDEAVMARYRQESAALAKDSIMRLSQIVVHNEEAAQSIRNRLPRADFARLARQRSEDEATAEQGGLIGEVRAADLAPKLADVAVGLTIGGVSEPVEVDGRWYLLKLDALRAVRLPPLDERRADIEAELRREALASALNDARSRVPVQMRDPAVIDAQPAEVAGTIALIRGQ